MPLGWQTGVLIPIFKKGDWEVCSNYRGTTLLILILGMSVCLKGKLFCCLVCMQFFDFQEFNHVPFWYPLGCESGLWVSGPFGPVQAMQGLSLHCPRSGMSGCPMWRSLSISGLCSQVRREQEINRWTETTAAVTLKL